MKNNLENKSDSELISLLKSKHQKKVFNVLFSRYQKIMYQLFMSQVKNKSIADDLCKQLWMTVRNNIQDYKQSDRFKDYLNTIATNLIKDHRQNLDIKVKPTSKIEKDSISQPKPARESRFASRMQKKTKNLDRKLSKMKSKLRRIEDRVSDYGILVETSTKSRISKTSEKNTVKDVVNFDAFFPRIIVPVRKYVLVVYASQPELSNDVFEDAKMFTRKLGGKLPLPKNTKYNSSIKIGTKITVVPESLNIDFDPPYYTKKWDGNWSRFLFDYEIPCELIGSTLIFSISIQIAGVEIASIRNCFVVVLDSNMEKAALEEMSEVRKKLARQKSTQYQKIFISYSHRDHDITRRYKMAQLALGNETFADMDNIRSGQDWGLALTEAIEEADVFQLFWSKNYATSRYCELEWNHAVDVKNKECDTFIRPVYWEKPMPVPPARLSSLHFKYVPLECI